MLSRTMNYFSHHAIAILALVCSLLALAGASYAAIQLPKNSVGAAQIKQGAVTPGKLSGTRFGGYVRMYAVVNANSKLQYSSPQAKLSFWGNSSQPGGSSFGTVSWKPTVSAMQCAAFATPHAAGPTTTGVGATIVPNLRGKTGTHVNVTWNGDSAIAVEVVCH
jgi:hypothetical protein